VEIIPLQRKKRGWDKGFIAVKPNCSLQSYLTPVHALVKAGFEVKRMIITTMQAGAAKSGVSVDDMADRRRQGPQLQARHRRVERDGKSQGEGALCQHQGRARRRRRHPGPSAGAQAHRQGQGQAQRRGGPTDAGLRRPEDGGLPQGDGRRGGPGHRLAGRAHRRTGALRCGVRPLQRLSSALRSASHRLRTGLSPLRPDPKTLRITSNP
jgi:hypothetical protein